MRTTTLVTAALLATAAAACGASPLSDDGEPTTSDTSSALTCATPVDSSRSLFVIDGTALAKFSFKRVMTAIVSSANVGTQTPLALYRQWWDLDNDTAHAAVATNPHCDDDGGTVNGFPIECPRQEGVLATTNPFLAGADHYSPIGIVNRFDLAPKNGANCGQYRVVFGKDSGKSNAFDRNLVIFEAVLPNPNPPAGLSACLPVAQFWDDLSADADATSRANKLDTFFFTGITGFQPVVEASHYGIGGGTNTGQIRANQFMPARSQIGVSQNWELREYRLSRPCTSATSCTLVMHLASVKNDPFPSLFAGTDTQSTSFQSAFLNQVPKLAAKSVPAIAMSTSNTFNGGESHEQSSGDQYEVAASSTFRSQIQSKLTAIGSTLTPTNILQRATTQSCAGCHQLEAGANLGGGLTWPASNGFTQVSETSGLSPALQNVFLPARKKVLEGFVDAHCSGSADAGSATSSASATDGTETIGGSVVGAAN